MGDDLGHDDEDLQVGSSQLQRQRADEEESQANRFESKLNERQGKLENHSSRRGLKHLQVLSKRFVRSFSR